MELLGLLLALPLLITWSYRGGSLGPKWDKWLPSLPHIVDRTVTPLFIVLSLISILLPLTLIQWIALGAGLALFVWGQIPGWGNQMDLGKNDKPDTEWGHTIRDWFFKSKSSFSRDLVGLYMRMLWFILPAIAWWFVNPLLSIIPLSLVFFGPLIWVTEHNKFWAKGKIPVGIFGKSWVEDVFGIMIFCLTIVIGILLYIL